ncbi:MAG: hypothetical protein ABT940_13290, partial [Alphaproteobacteria bacterium]
MDPTDTHPSHTAGSTPSLPRHRHWFWRIADRVPLLARVLLACLVLGALTMYGSYLHQAPEVREQTRERLLKHLAEEAGEDREDFEHAIQGHGQVVRIFGHQVDLRDHMTRWEDTPATETLLEWGDDPPWLPDRSLLGRFIVPEWFILLDEKGRGRETFQTSSRRPPPGLVHPSDDFLRITRIHAHVANLGDGGPLVIAASHTVRGENGTPLGTLLVGSRLDSRFLALAHKQRPHNDDVITLILRDSESPVASTDESRVPTGSTLSSLSQDYLSISLPFLDSGTTDIRFKLVSFLPAAILSEEMGRVLDFQFHHQVVVAVFFTVFFLIVLSTTAVSLRRL